MRSHWKALEAGVRTQYLTETTRSTSFLVNWKVLTPSERSMRSESNTTQASAPPEEGGHGGSEGEESVFTSIEFLIGVAVYVLDWTVSLQRLYQQRETFWFDSL